MPEHSEEEKAVNTWYSAHIIMFVECKKGIQTNFPIWENIVLIEADSADLAFEKAETRGRMGEGDSDGSFRWKDQPARWVFAGVRKLTECDNLHDRPGDGTEVTYNELEVDSRAAIDRLVAGDSILVRFEDCFGSTSESLDEDPEQLRRQEA